MTIVEFKGVRPPPVDPEPFIEMVKKLAAEGYVSMAIIAYRPPLDADDFTGGNYAHESYPDWLPIKNDLFRTAHKLMREAQG